MSSGGLDGLGGEQQSENHYRPNACVLFFYCLGTASELFQLLASHTTFVQRFVQTYFK